MRAWDYTVDLLFIHHVFNRQFFLLSAGSRYPEINRKVEKFVNKFREFPDYQDIRDIVIRSNNKFKLKFRSVLFRFNGTSVIQTCWEGVRVFLGLKETM